MFEVYLGIFICVLGALCITYGSNVLRRPFNGNVWGISIPAPSKFSFLRPLAVVAFIGGFVLFFYGFFVSLDADTGSFFDLTPVFGPIIGFIGGLIAGYILSFKWLEKLYAAEKNAAVLGDLPIMQEVAQSIPNAAQFLLAPGGLAFTDTANYCYKTIRFCDYQMGDLRSGKELDLVSLYLLQTYGDSFKRKVESANQGTSGAGAAQSVTAIYNLTTSTTVSYTFTRK